MTGRSNPPEPQQLATAQSHKAPSGETADDPNVGIRPQLGMAIGRALGTVVVTVHGDLNSATSPQLAEVLRDLIDDQGNLSVVVDVRSLTLSSPVGAAALAVAGHWAQRHGGTLSVAHASEPLRRALREGGAHGALRFVD